MYTKDRMHYASVNMSPRTQIGGASWRRTEHAMHFMDRLSTDINFDRRIPAFKRCVRARNRKRVGFSADDQFSCMQPARNLKLQCWCQGIKVCNFAHAVRIPMVSESRPFRKNLRVYRLQSTKWTYLVLFDRLSSIAVRSILRHLERTWYMAVDNTA